MAHHEIRFIRPRRLVLLLIFLGLFLFCALGLTAEGVEIVANHDKSADPGTALQLGQLLVALGSMISVALTGLFTYLTAKDRHKTELEKFKYNNELHIKTPSPDNGEGRSEQ